MKINLAEIIRMDKKDLPIKVLHKLQEILKTKQHYKRELNKYKTWVPPGHFYSPVPDLNLVREKEVRIWEEPDCLKEIDLNEAEQLALYTELSRYYKELPFADEKQEGMRYYFNNTSFCYADAIILYSMMRHLRPKRIIEAGSGFTSSIMLDTNELFFKNAIDCTFIEPYPDTLLSLFKEPDKNRVRLISQNLQEVSLDFFTKLEQNDILFIDSSHVSKIDSDVNYIFFKILPILKSGVYIHFHDIFYPFEYPQEWIYKGTSWNEAYILRAFLQNNSKYKIMLFNHYLSKKFAGIINETMPLCLKNPGGSIWLQKK